MDKNLDFELETRKKIYNYILKNPGVHLRELQRNLNIKIFNLKYHVQKLVKNGCIIQKKEDGYLRFFVIHTVSNGDKKVLGILRQKTARHIVLVALYEIAVSQKEICDFLQKSPSTINFHIKNLLKNNIIERISCENGIIKRVTEPKVLNKDLKGREVVFRLTDPHQIYTLLKRYKSTFQDEESKKIINLINQFVNSGLGKKKTSGYFGMSNVDAYVEFMFEVFPHPYHV